MKAALHSTRGTLVAGGLVLLIVAALGWTMLISPARADIDAAHQSRDQAQERQSLLTAQLARLRSQSGDLSRVRDRSTRLSAIVPPTADQPGFFTQVTQAARTAHLGAEAITVLSPSAPVTADAAAGGTTSGGLGGASLTGSAPVTALSSTLSAVLSAGDVAVQSVTLSVQGPPARLEAMLGALQRMQRAFLITGTAGQESDGVETLTLTGYTFVAPPIEQPRAASAAAGDATTRPGPA